MAWAFWKVDRFPYYEGGPLVPSPIDSASHKLHVQGFGEVMGDVTITNDTEGEATIAALLDAEKAHMRAEAVLLRKHEASLAVTLELLPLKAHWLLS